MKPRACAIADTFTTSAEPSSRALRACAAFGIVPIHDPASTRPPIHPDPTILSKIRASRVTHITGPSGSGKTTLLRTYASQLDTAPEPAPIKDNRTTIDAIRAPLESAAALLSACGIGEPKLWALPPSALSTGQQARLDIARRLSIAKPDQFVVLDELASCLDRITATSLCASIPKLAQRFNVRILSAASAEDVPSMLDACLMIDASSQSSCQSTYQPAEIFIERGDRDDYRAIKAHHYRTNDPAIIEHVLRAIHVTPDARRIVGVLTLSRPTLNASWRQSAFGTRFNSGNKKLDAQRINAELRTISRIIIEPRSRSLGIATRLVRAYLENPITPCTEAIATVGTLCGFFARAGMTTHQPRRPNADLRLLDALDHTRLNPQDLTRPHDTIKKPINNTLIQRELSTWARARKLDPCDPELATHAAVRLLSSPRAYTHISNGGNHERHQHGTQ